MKLLNLIFFVGLAYCQTASPAKPTAPANPEYEGCDVWNDGCNNCRVINGKLGECQKYRCKEQQTPYCKVKSSDLKSRVDKMFDGKNENGGLVDDITLER